MLEGRRSSGNRSGVAALEFLFVAPAFFVLVFFVVEIALIWTDRHMMRLAAYRAARTVVKMRAEAAAQPAAGLCFHLPFNKQSPPEEVDIYKKARRSSAKVMATVTPTMTQMFEQMASAAGISPGSEFVTLGSTLNSAVTSDVGEDSSSGGSLSSAGASPYVHAILRLMNGLPAAYVFTELACQDVQYPASPGVLGVNGVEITLIYHRSAKMPYVGSLMYMLRYLSELYKQQGLSYDGVSGMLRVNPLNYGFEFNLDTNDELYKKGMHTLIDTLETDVSNKTKSMVTNELNKLGTPAAAASGQTTKAAQFLAAGANLASSLGASTAIGTGVGDLFASVADKAEGAFNDVVMASAGIINAAAATGIEIFLASPNALKTIPLTVSVRIPNYSQAFFNPGDWQPNVIMLGGFNDSSNMGKLAQHLGKFLDEKSPPNNGMPFVVPKP